VQTQQKQHKGCDQGDDAHAMHCVPPAMQDVGLIGRRRTLLACQPIVNGHEEEDRMDDHSGPDAGGRREEPHGRLMAKPDRLDNQEQKVACIPEGHDPPQCSGEEVYGLHTRLLIEFPQNRVNESPNGEFHPDHEPYRNDGCGAVVENHRCLLRFRRDFALY
jgi:hypothetical protein